VAHPGREARAAVGGLIGFVHAGLGDRDVAFEWLERAFQTGDVHLLFVPADPKWDVFRADARMNTLIGKCRFAP
jgi:hypothetical protein